MADRLTQLQDCYDQLATQFYASIRYISTHHSVSALTPPPAAPITNSTSQSNNSTQPTTSTTTNNDNNNNITANHQSPPHTQDVPPPPQDPTTYAQFPEQRPDTPTTFAAAQRELAHDLVLKTQQIEYIVSILPGVEHSKERQEERIRALDGELRDALEERRVVEEVREEWVDRVEGVLGAVRR